MKALRVFLVLAVWISACTVDATVPPPVPTPAGSQTPLPSPSRTPRPAATITALPQATDIATPSTAVDSARLRGLHILYGYPASGDLATETAAQIETFNQTNVWGITVEGQAFPTSTQLEEQVLADEKAGPMPQAVSIPMEMLLTWQSQADVVVPLDAYIQDPEWGLSASEIADFYPAFWQAESVDGQRLGLPDGRDLQGILYNQSWAESLGFQQPPTTPAEFQVQACAAMKANLGDQDPANDGTGGWILSTDPLALESWRMAFGGGALPGVEGQPYVFDTPPATQAFTFLRTLVDENCAWTARNPSPYQYFAQRQALFYSGSLLDLPDQAAAMDFAGSHDRWTILPYPSMGTEQVVLTDGLSNAILRATPEEELAAWIWLRYLMLPRVEARLAAASSLVPARVSALDEIADYRASHPQWAQALGWKDRFQPAPQLASWRVARRVLQDAAWQIFSPVTQAGGIPGVLAELDATIADLLKANP